MIEIMRGAVGIVMGIVDVRDATSAITKNTSLLSTPGKCECDYGVLIHSVMLDATKKQRHEHEHIIHPSI
jgi:hypothetical protein